MRYRAARLSPGLDAAVFIVYVPEWPLHILFTVYIYIIYYVVRWSGARYLVQLLYRNRAGVSSYIVSPPLNVYVCARGPLP